MTLTVQLGVDLGENGLRVRGKRRLERRTHDASFITNFSVDKHAKYAVFMRF